jgi:hypothetical protein
VRSILSPNQTYEEKIAALVDQYITRRAGGKSISRLASALGCSNVPLVSDKFEVDYPTQPGEQHEALVRRTLVHALHSHMAAETPFSEDLLAIIDGLSKNDRWRDCLNTEDDAYEFAMLMLYYVRAREKGYLSTRGMQLASSIWGSVWVILNDWLSLEDRFMTLPSTAALANAIFGAPWCDVVLSNVDDSTGPLLRIIQTTRPTFTKGLLPEYAQPTRVELPSLG